MRSSLQKQAEDLSGYAEDPTAWTTRLLSLAFLGGLSYAAVRRLLKNIKKQREIQEEIARMSAIQGEQLEEPETTTEQPEEKKAIAWRDLTLPEKALYYAVDAVPVVTPDSVLRGLLVTLPLTAATIYFGSVFGSRLGDWISGLARDVSLTQRKRKAKREWEEALAALKRLPEAEKKALHQAMTKEASIKDILVGLSLMSFLATLPMFYHMFRPSSEAKEHELARSRALYAETGAPFPIKVDPEELQALTDLKEKKPKERSIRL